MNNSEDEWNVSEEMNLPIYSVVRENSNKISDDNDYKTDMPFLSTEIMKFKEITIKVLDYTIKNNRSKIKKGVEIYIRHNSYNIGEENQVNYNGKITFGRNGDIKFEEFDQKISKEQFQIRITDGIPYIVCLTPPPKMPTAFKINEVPYFLEKDHIICFGKKTDLIFKVHYLDDYVIIFQQISFIDKVKLNPKMFVFKKGKESIFGSALPLTSPEIEAFDVNLGFVSFNERRWYFRRNLASKTDQYAYLWIFKFDQLQKINIDPFKFESIESRQVSLRSGVILNIGNCDLKIEGS